MRDTPLRALNNNFIGLGGVTLGLTLRVVTGESDLDVVLVFESDNVLATLTNQRRVVLARDLQDLDGLVRLVACKLQYSIYLT